MTLPVVFAARAEQQAVVIVGVFYGGQDYETILDDERDEDGAA